MGLKFAIRRAFWSVGLDLAKDSPDNSLPSYLRMLLRDLEIDCVLDVGGHRGEFATGLRTFGYTGRIISFEPVKVNYEHLRQAASRDPQWQVLNYALGASESEIEINVTEATVLSSFLTPLSAKVTARELVLVRRLDQVLPDLVGESDRCFLKMDTQGFDLEVVRGAAGVLDRIPGALTEMSIVPLYETSPNFADAITELRAAGFHPSAMFPVLRRGHRLVEFDCVLVR